MATEGRLMGMERGRWFRELVRYGLACAVASAGVFVFAVAPARPRRRKTRSMMTRVMAIARRHATRSYEKNVEEACDKQARRCFDSDSCNDLLQKMGLFNLCIAARRTVMKECFRGGNQKHKNKAAEVVNGWKRCSDFYSDKVTKGECPILACPIDPRETN